MKISENDKQILVEFEKLEKESEGFKIGARIIKESVVLFNNKYWIEIDEAKKFVNKLDLDSKKILATLNSMSPKEFQILIESVDNLGHFLFRIHLTQAKYVQSKRCLNEFVLNIEMDWMDVQKLKNEFSMLI